ncbi:MAG: hypothetical protein IJP18_04825, partial [Oscillospiraceae bacterium]|nr:hypothetical protein [Oscillospiraceae bacterium]
LDGTLNISDVILLQKWFISADNTTISDLNVTDLNGNGKTDIADMCMLKQLLIDSVY